MSDKSIDELPTLPSTTALNGTELVIVTKDTNTYKMTLNDFLLAMPSE
jgi:hypothetical protein